MSFVKLTVALVAVGMVAISHASNIKDLKKSIFKIVTQGELRRDIGVATAFVVSHRGENLIVTNNHVCGGFYKSADVFLVESGTFTGVPQKESVTSELDHVKQYYMHPGSDICILISQRSSKYPALNIDKKGTEPTKDIMVAGFVGRSMDLMYVTGKVYGTVRIEHPRRLIPCDENTPKQSKITCKFFKSYPDYKKTTMQIAVNNIGPGFSGSPVLSDGKVVGVVSGYLTPSLDYSNGDVIFFTASDLLEAIRAATKNKKDEMVPVNSTRYMEFVQTSAFDEAISEFLEETEEDLNALIESLFEDLYGR